MSKNKPRKNQLLLLDLDGVAVFGGNPGEGQPEELRLLHPELPRILANSDIDIILFTHRAFADARQIRAALVEFGVPVLHCISAREILLSALQQARISDLLSAGLSKKYGIAQVVKRANVNAAQLALIDDRAEIIAEVQTEGIGFGLHAPFEIQTGKLVSFDFLEVLEILDRKPTTSEIIPLTPVTKLLDDLPVITSISGTRVASVELLIRKIFRKTRQFLTKKHG